MPEGSTTSGPRGLAGQIRGWIRGHHRNLIPGLLMEGAPVDLRLVGRTLVHAALVGLAAGLAGAAFVWSLEAAQRFFLEGIAGYIPLRAHGQQALAEAGTHVFRPWMLLVLPAFGGLICGWLARFSPEIRGGGGDAAIEAFHHDDGRIRRRVLFFKPIASLFVLGTGGSGGREGPTMQIGGALGSAVADLLRVGPRERRILLVAGIAAGMAAVFRTPLGAALLAVEIIYRDGFESEALVPAVLASVVAYSVVILIFGQTTLFSHAGGFPFTPRHLPLYGLLAIILSLLAVVFLRGLATMRRLVKRFPGPAWLAPMWGGLVLGVLITPVLVIASYWIHAPGQGLGILGGGYGAVQVAITGAPWMPHGWEAAALLTAIAVAKLIASSITIGSGGSAGDFAPSLAIGGLFGGAFGIAAQLITGDPSIDPGAFALVGMGAFYGGIAHVPLAALVFVCELAGNYDLLVPLMLTQGIAFVALRKWALYSAQPATQADSPVHRDVALLAALRAVTVREAMIDHEAFAVFEHKTPAHEMLRFHGDATWQNVFPVRGSDGRVAGIVTGDTLRILAAQADAAAWTVAADVIQPLVHVGPDDDLRTAAEKLVAHGLRALPVIDAEGQIVGFLDEARIAETSLGIKRKKVAAAEVSRAGGGAELTGTVASSATAGPATITAAAETTSSAGAAGLEGKSGATGERS